MDQGLSQALRQDVQGSCCDYNNVYLSSYFITKPKTLCYGTQPKNAEVTKIFDFRRFLKSTDWSVRFFLYPTFILNEFMQIP